jgi:hypothetical protein
MAIGTGFQRHLRLTIAFLLARGCRFGSRFLFGLSRQFAGRRPPRIPFWWVGYSGYYTNPPGTF